MTTLIIGGAGFIGANVCRLLLRQNEPITIYDLPGENRPIDVILTGNERSQIRSVAGDVMNPLSLVETMRDTGAERIIHLASLLTPASQANPPAGIRINAEGTVNVFEAARILGISRVVWASSAQIFGPLDRYRATFGVDVITDDSPPYPNSIYGATKLLLEQVARQYARAHGLDTVALRPPGLFGPGRKEGATAYIVDLLRSAVAGERTHVERGDWIIPLLYVEDVARAFALAALAPQRFDGAAYNIGGYLTTAREIAEIVRGLVPSAEIDVEACEQRPAARIDAAGIREALGFKPEFTLEAALGKTLAEIRSSG